MICSIFALYFLEDILTAKLGKRKHKQKFPIRSLSLILSISGKD